jgi:dipeptidase
LISPFFRIHTVEIVVPNGEYRQSVAVEKIKNLLERCQRITRLESTKGGGKRREVNTADRTNICVIEPCGIPEPPTSKKRRLPKQTVASLSVQGLD